MASLSLQHPFSLTASVQASVERVLTPERLKRYLRKESSGDQHRALRLYLWNVQLCEAFYGPLHIAEIAIRNGIQRALEVKFQRPDWYDAGAFTSQLSQTIASGLLETIKQTRRDHGIRMTENHIVSSLSFGFWSHILTVNFEKCGVWPFHFKVAFPNKQPGLQRDRVLFRLETLRDFRNRVAHHMAICDDINHLNLVHSTILELVKWCSHDARWLIEEIEEFSRIKAVINLRPTI